MSGIGLLVPDILNEIMRRLPSDIDQKFAFSQVSPYWRDVALHDHLFWSSFSGGRSKADCYRIPTILERSGSAMLHVQFRFSDGHTPLTDWHAYATEALVPHAKRVETLDVEFWVYSTHSVAPRVVQALLNSGLEFPALQTLRLEGPEYGHAPNALLTAPQLRTLDIERFNLSNWAAFWSPSLESIRLHGARNVTLQTLLDISDRCPRARRVGLEMRGHSSDDLFEALARRRPLAPALRELELITPELGLILKAGFSDVLLHTITGCLYNADIDVLAEALLPGAGPLVVYDLDSGMRQLELCANKGRIRRFQCRNEDSSFEVKWTWEHLCIHYKLHETVQEIRTGIAYCHDYRWNQFAEVFQNYPPSASRRNYSRVRNAPLHLPLADRRLGS
ncbi:hypothetical protein C8R45DRAFT_567592 [Mycena sanguinolenta]|nr:hypothetical protein C8R45DRAFT_567592 [Mycena sanguinolenta]